MIILITGASHTGKTLLAQKLLEKYKYPYLSVDHLKMGLIRSGNTELTPDDDNELTEYLWPIVREMIKTAIENKQNLIFEGCYIPFDWKKDFSDEYLSDIRFICLCLSNGYIDKYFSDIKRFASCIESRLYDDCFSADEYKRDNRFYLEGFGKNNPDVFLIEKDYTESINKILSGFSYSE